jgi:CDP-paratose synthetase
MKILITGGSGFLGSNLALALLSQGHDISLLLRPTSSLIRFGEQLKYFTICYCENDNDISNFIKLVSPDIVIHTAASLGRNNESLLELYDANYRFGLSVLQCISSINKHVYFINTNTALDAQLNLYSYTKYNFANTGKMIAKKFPDRISFINILMQIFYGPGDNKSSFVTKIINNCKSNQEELQLTAGIQNRDFIFIEDVTSAYVSIIKNLKNLENVMDIDVGSGKTITIKEFVETVHRLSKSSIDLNFGALPFRKLEPMNCKANIIKLKSFGWKQEYSIEAGITKTLDQMVK